jgi:hypothetical protein
MGYGPGEGGRSGATGIAGSAASRFPLMADAPSVVVKKRANTAGPRHGGGTTGRVQVRGGSLTPRFRLAALVGGDHGYGCAHSPKIIENANTCSPENSD